MMKFHEFVVKVQNLRVFTREQLKCQFTCSSHQLNQDIHRWIKAGKLRSLRRGLYCISPAFRGPALHPLEAAQQLHPSSYISLTTALEYHKVLDWNRIHDRYNLLRSLPEPGVITSITSRKTLRLQNFLGAYYYHHSKPELYWGYQTQPVAPGIHSNIADSHKALIDLWYFYPAVWSSRIYRLLKLDPEPIDTQTLQACLHTPHTPARMQASLFYWIRYSCEEQGIPWKPHRAPPWLKISEE